MAYLGERDFSERQEGKIMHSILHIWRTDVQTNIAPLLDSEFPLYNPEQKSVRSRVTTFTNLDMEANIKSAQQFSEAGWHGVETPVGLGTRCVSCGGETRGWSPEDCTWVENLCMYPGCPYLHATLEEEEIRAMISGHLTRIQREAQWPVAAFDYFKKRLPRRIC